MSARKVICFLFVLFISSKFFGQTTFTNPVITGLASDPSICRVGDDYYLVTSTFEYFPGLPIYQSKDLVHWKLIGYALTRASQNPLKNCESSTGGQYAPTIRYNNGTFYIACTNYGGTGSKGSFYVTATDPAGEWSEPYWVGDWGHDPSLLFANDSVYYIHPEGCDGYFMQTTLNLKTGKFNTAAKRVADGTGGSCPEGPHMYKINDKYYLMAAEGGTGYQHMETMQRSDSPWGPFEESPINPIISHKNFTSSPFQALGHADLVETPDGWWLVCLGIRPRGGNYHHLGRETFLAPVTWDEDGWPKVGANGTIKEEMTAPNLPQYIWEKDPIRDEFDSTKLNLNWNFIRNPYASDWSLTQRSGYLRLNGSSRSFTQKDSPAFIGRRQTAFDIVASAKIDFTPTKLSEEAGLVIRGNDTNHFDLLITKLGEKRVVMFRSYLEGEVKSIKYQEIADGEITLRISATDIQYQFWVEEDGKKAELIANAETKNLSTEVIDGFTGVFIGMYASGNGMANSNPADFDWFEFEENAQAPYSWVSSSEEKQNDMNRPEIVSISSTACDNIILKWNDIENETNYIIERFDETRFDTIATLDANSTEYTDLKLLGGTSYLYRISGKNDLGYSQSSLIVSGKTLPLPLPYFGKPSVIPGKIEAENYDSGYNGSAFYDTTTGNSQGAGVYRSDDVDIESCTDTDAGYDITAIANNEWLTYTVDVNDTIFDIELRIAASYGGGKIAIYLNDEQIATTNILSTGGWKKWKSTTISKVKMTKGDEQVLKLMFPQSGFNLNWINFTQSDLTKAADLDISKIGVFPNPTDGLITIEGSMGFIPEIGIYTIDGKFIKAFQTEKRSPITIDLSDLEHGIYIGKIRTATNQIVPVKIIKK